MVARGPVTVAVTGVLLAKKATHRLPEDPGEPAPRDGASPTRYALGVSIPQQALRVEISINGEARDVPHDTTVATLLQTLSFAGRVAVAVNQSVVPRSHFSTRRVCHGDRIEILEAVGGG